MVFPREENRHAIQRASQRALNWRKMRARDRTNLGDLFFVGVLNRYRRDHARLLDRFEPLDIGRDHVLGLFKDEYDVEYVQFYDLIKPEQ